MNPTKQNEWIPVTSLKVSPTDQSRANLYDDHHTKLVSEIKKTGMDSLEPILVRPSSNGMYTIITGESTLTAVNELIANGQSIDNIKCNVYENITKVEELYLKFNEVNGQTRHTFDMSTLVTKLHDLGVKNVDIAKNTGVHQERIPFLKKVDKLPRVIKKAVAKHKITMAEISTIVSTSDENEYNTKISEITTNLKHQAKKEAMQRFLSKHKKEKPAVVAQPHEISPEHKVLLKTISKLEKAGADGETISMLKSANSVLDLIETNKTPTAVMKAIINK